MFLMISLLIISANATSQANGVDDWDAKQVQSFLENNFQVHVSDQLLSKQGIDGHAFMSLTSQDLSNLEISSDKHDQILNAIEAKRSAIAKNPVDYWEWRAGHLRLSDFWINDLFTESRLILLYSRFFDVNQSIEMIDNEIDEISLANFAIYFFVCPSYPLYKISQKLSDNTYFDEVLEYALCLKFICECLTFGLLFVKSARYSSSVLAYLSLTLNNILMFAKDKAIEMAKYTAFACFDYYVLWWILPRAVVHAWFHFKVYVVLPAVVFFSLVVLIFIIYSVVAPAPKSKTR
jgi:hypothetical protein